jgi:hypothetical protein
MRKITNAALLIFFSVLLFTSCKKEVKSTQDTVSQEAIAKITALGFSTSNVQKVDEGYLVEGDIILTEENLNSAPGGNLLRVANTEQYRTTNLVTGTPRTIVISTSGANITTRLSDGINAAIARYNAENLTIKFSRGGSNGGGNINIRVVNSNQFIASSGFPSAGKPYFEVQYAKTYTTTSWSVGVVTTVIAHEVGHCIGFRHTDYMNRAYSCGGSAVNEGASNIGAILIPGTPSGPDALSWMLACLSATTNRPFNANDKTALNYVY